jgi:hypothetical protein
MRRPAAWASNRYVRSAPTLSVDGERPRRAPALHLWEALLQVEAKCQADGQLLAGGPQELQRNDSMIRSAIGAMGPDAPPATSPSISVWTDRPARAERLTAGS